MPRARPLSAACRRALVAVTVVAACCGATPAFAGSITVLPQSSSLQLAGYPSGAALGVDVVRNGTVVARAAGTTTSGGRLDVNPGACWGGFTPVLNPGDTVRVSGGGAPDSVTVQAVTVGMPQVGALGDVTVSGAAPGSNGLAARIFGGFGGPLQAPGEGAVSFDPGSASWTATFPAAAVGANPVSSARALYAAPDGGVTIADAPAPAAGPSGGCTGALKANAVANVDPAHLVGGRPVINIENAGAPLTVSGPAGLDVTGITATLGSAQQAAATSGGTWNATFPASALAAQPDGAVVAGGTFAGAADTAGAPLTLTKDTSAPGPPTSSPPPGRYTNALSVTLASAEPGSRIHFTVDGSAPTAASPIFSAPVRIANTQTVRAFAVDAVGNAGPVATLGYQLGAGAGPPGDDPGPGTGNGIGNNSGDNGSGFARIASLTLVKRISLRKLRKSGLAVTVNLVRGTTAVRFTVYRRVTTRGKPRLKLVSSVVRVPGSGRWKGRLIARSLGLTRRGLYRLRIVPGLSRTTFDQTAARTVWIRVVR